MIKANETAFPVPGDQSFPPTLGLTKREYFAAMAMQGMLTSYPLTRGRSPHFAKAAVNFADALLAALDAKSDETNGEL